MDLGAAIQNLLLAVHAAGLGAVWICLYNQIVLGQLVKAPKGLEPAVMVPVGRYDHSVTHGNRKRRAISEIVFHEDFDHPIES
jgi:nitroreductase